MMMKKIPYGLTSFVNIIRDDCYYVDKTRFIRNLEDEGNYIIFLRPRRYGKSLFIAMLDAYYNIRYADRFEELFGKLDIGKNPTQRHNTYLVLSLNFSDVDSDKEKVEESFNKNILAALRKFARMYQETLPAGTVEKMEAHTNSNDAFIEMCNIVSLTDKKLYVMIDEYDNFANTLMSYDELAYTDLTHGDGFFRLFFNTLKAQATGNDSAIERLYISGVSPLTLSDVTSGFNIGDNFSLLPKYNDMIGFTEQEVREMLEYYRDATGNFRHTIDQLLEVIRPWYDNNCFSDVMVGAEHMYNSDMVLFFINHYRQYLFNIPNRMIDPNVSSDYGKMRKMIRLEQTFGEKAQTLQKIAEDGYINAALKSEFSISELHNPQTLPSLLFYMGMLTFGTTPEGEQALIVPNLVVREQYYKYLNECYDRNMEWQMEMWKYEELGYRMAHYGEGEPLLRFVAEQIRENSHTRDFDARAESFVKGYMLAKLGGMVSYFISETEPALNHGYADLYLEPWTEKTRHAYVIELKYCNATATDNEVEKLRLEAIAQAERYVNDKHLQQRATAKGWMLHKFVIVFRGWKLCHIEELGI